MLLWIKDYGPGSNVSLSSFGEVDPVLAGPARKPVVRHRRSRLHGEELSAVLATIRHVLVLFLRVPRSLPHFGQTIGSFAPHLARAIHSAALSASAKRCERIQSAYSFSVASTLFPDKFRSEWLSGFDDVAVIRIVEGLADLLFCFDMKVVRVHRVAKRLLVNLSKPFQKTRIILLLGSSFRQYVVPFHIRRFLVSQRDNPQNLQDCIQTFFDLETFANDRNKHINRYRNPDLALN